MKRNTSVSRRTFLKTANVLMAAPYVIPSGVLAAPGRAGANDRIIVGHIGWGGRSGSLYQELGPLRDKGESQSVAVCDVDENRLAGALKDLPGATPYRDYRYLLQRKDIDAVVIGTPDHWHGVQTVHSAECGKHIYVEKPACCTIEEGQAMVAAAAKNKVAVQVGSQGRSQPEAYLMHRYLVNGVIGKVDHVECFHYPTPEDNNPVPDSDPPPQLDWDYVARSVALAAVQPAVSARHVPLDAGIGGRPDPRSRGSRDELRDVVDGTGRDWSGDN